MSFKGKCELKYRKFKNNSVRLVEIIAMLKNIETKKP